MLFLIEFLDSYNSDIGELRDTDVVKLYSTIKNCECTQKENEVLAKFLVPVCIIGNYMLPISIAEFSFWIVNNLLASQSFPENEWEKLEKILPEVAFYNNWDRCKRLRKGFKRKGYTFKGIEEEDIPIYLL